LKPGEQINNYLNRDAFVLPAPGALGNATRNFAVGPAFWQVDLAVSKLVSVVGMQRLELRVEAFKPVQHLQLGRPRPSTSTRQISGASPRRPALRAFCSLGLKYDF
jgi:hypothetical protein